MSSTDTLKPILAKIRPSMFIRSHFGRSRIKNNDTNEQNIKTILFDYDGTLANSLELGYEVLEQLCIQYGYKCLPKERYRLIGTRQVIKEMGIPMWRLPRLMRAGRRLMANRITEVSPVEGIVETIKELYQLNISLGVVTSNSGNNVETWLKYHNISQYFSIILGGGGLLRKERCIRKVMAKYQIKPDELLYVGDESRDIIACKRLKVNCVAVTWGLDLEEKLLLDHPDLIARQPKDLTQIVNDKNP
jgi:phosphoglycolate phosphatase-like HAD superfamily hydrolase